MQRTFRILATLLALAVPNLAPAADPPAEMPLDVRPTTSPTTAPVIAPVDPTKFIAPSTQPVPRRLAKDYVARRDKRLKTIPLQTVDNKEIPIVGLYVNKVSDPKLTEKGMQIGDIITLIEGVPVATSDQFVVDEGELTWWDSVSRKLRKDTCTLNRDTAGVEPYWRADLAYSRSGENDPRWHKDLLFASLMLDRIPDLAETALRQAYDAGYRGAFLPAMMMVISQNQLEHDRALEWATFALPAMPEDQRKPLAERAFVSAVWSYKFQEALRIQETYSPIEDAERIEAVKKLAAAADATVRANPAKLSETRKTTDLTKQIVPSLDNTDNERRAQEEMTKGRVRVTARAGHFHRFQMGPAVADGQITMSAAFDLSEKAHLSKWYPMFSLGLYSQADPDQGPIIKAVLYADGRVEVGGPDYPLARLRVYRPFARPKKSTITCTFIDNDIEIVVDGRRLFHGPLAGGKDRQLGFYVHVVGVNGFVEDVKWLRFEPVDQK